MKPRSNLVLLLLAAALGLYVAVSARRGTTVTGSDGAASRYDPVTTAEITGFELVRSNVVLVLERTNDAWLMTRPVVSAVQSASVDKFLAAAARLTPRTFVSSRQVAAQPDALKAFGLGDDAPRLTLRTRGQPVILRLGGASPLGGQFYFQRIGSDGVFTADDTFLAALPASPNDWRDRALLDLRNVEFDRLEIRGPTRLEAVRQAGGWLLKSPLTARAHSELFDSVLAQLQTLRVAEFLRDGPLPNPEDYGLQPPEAELVLGRGTN